jgi:hypothetical protein
MKKDGHAPTAKRCGACNACCVELTIDTPEFKKDGLVPCPHLTTQGCGIYATRFKVCRDFLCGWHLTPALDNDWRPDLSGVLILHVAQASLPAAYRPAGNGVQFLITGGEAAIARPGFAEYVADLVSREVGVYLTVTAPHALVNEHLQPVAAAGDVAAMVRTLTYLYRLVVAARDNKSILRTLPHLYRLNVEKRRALAKIHNK